MSCPQEGLRKPKWGRQVPETRKILGLPAMGSGGCDTPQTERAHLFERWREGENNMESRRRKSNRKGERCTSGVPGLETPSSALLRCLAPPLLSLFRCFPPTLGPGILLSPLRPSPPGSCREAQSPHEASKRGCADAWAVLGRPLIPLLGRPPAPRRKAGLRRQKTGARARGREEV